jgi:hypothetical protein
VFTAFCTHIAPRAGILIRFALLAYEMLKQSHQNMFSYLAAPGVFSPSLKIPKRKREKKAKTEMKASLNDVAALSIHIHASTGFTRSEERRKVYLR